MTVVRPLSSVQRKGSVEPTSDEVKEVYAPFGSRIILRKCSIAAFATYTAHLNFPRVGRSRAHEWRNTFGPPSRRHLGNCSQGRCFGPAHRPMHQIIETSKACFVWRSVHLSPARSSNAPQVLGGSSTSRRIHPEAGRFEPPDCHCCGTTRAAQHLRPRSPRRLWDPIPE